MKDDYIELKQDRDIGAIINVFFDFLKQNIKNFTNIFISYNGIFILLFLGISYLMVTGGMGMIKNAKDGTGLAGMSEDTALIYLGLGGLLFVIILMFVGALNYSLATAYMVKYESGDTTSPVKEEVWELVKQNSGNIIIYILLLIFMYIGFMIVSVVLAFIPLLGMIAQYIIQFGFLAWLGIAFVSMISENSSAVDGLGEGWKFVKENFWRCVGVNFILGILLFILMTVLIAIPGIIIGVYTFHVVDSGIDVTESATAKIVYIVGFSLLLIIMTYVQTLSQFANGILYYALHEKEYNTNTINKIDQIGAGEESL